MNYPPPLFFLTWHHSLFLSKAQSSVCHSSKNLLTQWRHLSCFLHAFLPNITSAHDQDGLEGPFQLYDSKKLQCGIATISWDAQAFFKLHWANSNKWSAYFSLTLTAYHLNKQMWKWIFLLNSCAQMLSQAHLTLKSVCNLGSQQTWKI